MLKNVFLNVRKRFGIKHLKTLKKMFWISTQGSPNSEPFDFTVNAESKIWFKLGGTPHPMDHINQKLLEAELKK